MQCALAYIGLTRFVLPYERVFLIAPDQLNGDYPAGLELSGVLEPVVLHGVVYQLPNVLLGEFRLRAYAPEGVPGLYCIGVGFDNLRRPCESPSPVYQASHQEPGNKDVSPLYPLPYASSHSTHPFHKIHQWHPYTMHGISKHFIFCFQLCNALHQLSRLYPRHFR